MYVKESTNRHNSRRNERRESDRNQITVAVRNPYSSPEPETGREFRDIQASNQDAIELIQGNRYTVRYGKQVIGHYPTLHSASHEAGRKSGIVYEIIRSKSQNGRSAEITLQRIDDIPDSETPAELIARDIVKQLGATDGPVSPLSKARAVALLQSCTKDRGLSEEAFLVIYPSSSPEQFERLWDSIFAKPNDRNNNRTHTVTQEQRPKHEISEREKLLSYAQTHGWEKITEALITENVKECVKHCIDKGISQKQLDGLVDYSVSLGVIQANKRDALKNNILRHLARHTVEQRLDGEVLGLINNNKFIAKMAASGNSDGIEEELSNRGFNKRESEELASEIMDLSKLINMM